MHPTLKTAAAIAVILFCFSDARAASPLSGHSIVIDPGHAVLNFEGTVINAGKTNRDGNLREHKIAFEISQKLGKLLQDEGATVIYTRTPADYWRQGYTATDDNKARALLANELKADVFMAIHCDWDPRSRVQGVTTYYETPESKKLSVDLQTNLVKSLKAENRHCRRDTYTVLDVAAMPAVIVETGFLSNRSEARKLGNPDYQTKIARALASGLRSYFAN